MAGNTHGESPLRHIELGPLKTIDRPEATISPCLKYFTGEMQFGDKVHVRLEITNSPSLEHASALASRDVNVALNS